LHIKGDPSRLAQVLANLLSNAAKFMPSPGRIALSVEQEDGEAVIRVHDGGIGIAPELLPRVFDLFVQGDAGLARSRGGLGLGLTLVKRVVELHNGRVEVHSAGAGQGSEFVVRLPSLPAPLAGLGEGSERKAAHNGLALRVLVVEDNRDTAESFMMVLQLGGHDVRMASNASQALELLDDFAPQVAFIDIGLPDIDGYQLASCLRAHPACAHTLLVALTGYGSDSDRRRATQAGFDHHLTKPANYESVERLLGNVGGRLAEPLAAG
jgi:CheY-like chemotaxis protein